MVKHFQNSDNGAVSVVPAKVKVFLCTTISLLNTSYDYPLLELTQIDLIKPHFACWMCAPEHQFCNTLPTLRSMRKVFQPSYQAHQVSIYLY